MPTYPHVAFADALHSAAEAGVEAMPAIVAAINIICSTQIDLKPLLMKRSKIVEVKDIVLPSSPPLDMNCW
jgi:hypothetical protein